MKSKRKDIDMTEDTLIIKKYNYASSLVMQL